MALTDLVAEAGIPVDGLTLSVVLGGVVLAVLWRIFALRLDPREPPAYQPGLPVIGHVVGLIRESHSYWPRLYKERPMPICTLPMFNGKMYFVSSPELISAVFKSRTLSFDPHLKKTLSSLTPISKPALEQYVTDAFFQPWIKFNYSTLTGAGLQYTIETGLTDIFHTLNHLPHSMEVEDTWIWFRSMLTMSTISALLGRGPRNPWRRNRSLVGRFWEFDQHVHHFVAGPASWLTAPGAHSARAEIVAALTEYCRAGGPSGDNDNADGVSALVRAATSTMAHHGWSDADQGAMLLAVIFAAVTNTVPTAFWCLLYALADAKLTKRLRREVAALVTEDAGGTTRTTRKKRQVAIDLRGLQDETRCPLLAATFRETQRHVGVAALHRWVEADTTLADPASGRTYLLRGGTPLQISGMLRHGDAAHWGPRADAFDPDRFLRTPATDKTVEGGDAPVPRGAFIPFGGGRHVCPGRNFATAEAWGMLVALLLGFDITTVEGRPPTVPGRRMPMLTNGVGHPVADADLRLSIRRRKGWEDVVWKVADLSNKTD